MASSDDQREMGRQSYTIITARLQDVYFNLLGFSISGGIILLVTFLVMAVQLYVLRKFRTHIVVFCCYGLLDFLAIVAYLSNVGSNTNWQSTVVTTSYLVTCIYTLVYREDQRCIIILILATMYGTHLMMVPERPHKDPKIRLMMQCIAGTLSIIQGLIVAQTLISFNAPEISDAKAKWNLSREPATDDSNNSNENEEEEERRMSETMI